MKKFTKCMVILASCLAMTAVGAWALTSVNFDVTGGVFFIGDPTEAGVAFKFEGAIYSKSSNVEHSDLKDLIEEKTIDVKAESTNNPAGWTLPPIQVTTVANVVEYSFKFTNNSVFDIKVKITTAGINATYFDYSENGGTNEYVIYPGADYTFTYSLTLKDNVVNENISSTPKFTIAISKTGTTNGATTPETPIV